MMRRVGEMEGISLMIWIEDREGCKVACII